jgi:hypothetical protein
MALERTLARFNIRLDPFLLEHLTLSIPECSDSTERRDLLQPFLEESGI